MNNGKQEFIDHEETPTDPEELERLRGKKDYEKYLQTRFYRWEYQLMKACCHLSPLQRTIIALHFFENYKRGYSFRKIKKILNLPLSRVYREYKRALRIYKRWENSRRKHED